MGAVCQKKLGKVFLAKAFAFMGPSFLEMFHPFPFVSHLTVPQDSFSLGCYLDYFRFCLLSPFDSRRIKTQVLDFRTSPSGSAVKICLHTGDEGSIPGSGRSPGGRHDNPLQYSCLENPTDTGAWRATIRRVASSQTQLK